MLPGRSVKHVSHISAAKGIEKNTLATSIVAYHLADLDSGLYWSSSVPGTATLSDGVTLFRPR